MILGTWTAAIRSWAQLHSDVMEVWLYGSYARGEETDDSDLDLAVVPTGDSEERLATFICDAREWEEELQAVLPVKVHLELGDRKQSNAIVGPALDREGVRIYPVA